MAKIKELVLINEVTSNLAVTIAKRINHLNYPALIVSTNASLINGIFFEHPELVATAAIDGADLTYLKEAVLQAQAVYGGLKKVVTLGGLMDPHIDLRKRHDSYLMIDSAKRMLAITESVYRLAAEPSFGEIQMLSVTNQLPPNPSRYAYKSATLIPWDNILKNFSIISTLSTVTDPQAPLHIIEKKGINEVLKAEPPYDETSIANLVIKMMTKKYQGQINGGVLQAKIQIVNSMPYQVGYDINEI